MMPKKRRGSIPICLTVAVVFLFGTLVGNAGATAEPVAKAAPVPAPAYHYNPLKKPDPFRSFIEAEIAAQKKMVAKIGPIPISPLQRAAVDQYTLKGISGDKARRSAVVLDKEGKFYPLFRGTIIGQNNGKVVEILPDRVIVEEAVKTEGGQSKVNRITMKLHTEAEGKP